MATLSTRQCMINDDGKSRWGGNMQGVYYAVDYELHIGTVGSITGSSGDRGGTSVDGDRGCRKGFSVSEMGTDAWIFRKIGSL